MLCSKGSSGRVGSRGRPSASLSGCELRPGRRCTGVCGFKLMLVVVLIRGGRCECISLGVTGLGLVSSAKLGIVGNLGKDPSIELAIFAADISPGEFFSKSAERLRRAALSWAKNLGMVGSFGA